MMMTTSPSSGRGSGSTATLRSLFICSLLVLALLGPCCIPASAAKPPPGAVSKRYQTYPSPSDNIQQQVTQQQPQTQTLQQEQQQQTQQQGTSAGNDVVAMVAPNIMQILGPLGPATNNANDAARES